MGYRRLLLEILNRPNFAGAGYVNTACDFGVICVGHVYVVTVFIEVLLLFVAYQWHLAPSRHVRESRLFLAGYNSLLNTPIVDPRKQLWGM